MTDGITISFPSNTIITDLQSLGVPIHSKTDRSTGEIKKDEAKHGPLNCKILRSGIVEVRGSLPKYLKGENYSDFTFTDLCSAIEKLSNELNFDPSDARMHSIEWGVNIIVPFNPYGFANNLISYKAVPFNKYFEQKKDIGFWTKSGNLILKAYDKGKQSGQQSDIFRLEAKAIRMAYLHNLNINTLSDLTNLNNYEKLGQMLISIYDEIIVRDEVNRSDLSANELRIYNECINPKQWSDYSPKMRCERKKYYAALIDIHGKKKWKSEVRELIINKWQQLSAYSELKSGNDFTSLAPLKSGNDFTPIEKTNRECFDTTNSMVNHTSSIELEILPTPAPVKREQKEAIKTDHNFKNPKTNSPGTWERDFADLVLYFETAILPDKPFKLNYWSTITNVSKFVETNIATVKEYNGRGTIMPNINRLRELKTCLDTNPILSA